MERIQPKYSGEYTLRGYPTEGWSEPVVSLGYIYIYLMSSPIAKYEEVVIRIGGVRWRID